MDGKALRHCHDRGQRKDALHLVSAFDTTASAGPRPGGGRGQEQRTDGHSRSFGELAEIPSPPTPRSPRRSPRRVPIICWRQANQATLRVATERAFGAAAPSAVETCVDFDKGQGRIERHTGILREAYRLNSDRGFPANIRGAATLVRVPSRAEFADHSRFEARYPIASAQPTANQAAPSRARPLGRRIHWRMPRSLLKCLERASRVERLRSLGVWTRRDNLLPALLSNVGPPQRLFGYAQRLLPCLP